MANPKENQKVEEPKVTEINLSNLGKVNDQYQDIKLNELDGKEVKVSGYLYRDHGNGYYGLVQKPQDKNVKIYLVANDGAIPTKLGKEVTVQGVLDRGLLTNATLV